MPQYGFQHGNPQTADLKEHLPSGYVCVELRHVYCRLIMIAVEFGRVKGVGAQTQTQTHLVTPTVAYCMVNRTRL